MPSIAWLRKARSTSLADGYSTSCTAAGSRWPSSRARYSGSLPIQTLVPMRSAVSGSRMQPRERERRATHASGQQQRRARSTSCASPAHAPVRHEDVALVADGPDEPRMLGIGLDLLAQPHDAQVDAAVERIPVALLVRFRMRSRDSGRFGCSASAFSRSNSSGDIGTSAPCLVGEPVRGEVEHAAADAHPLGADLGAAARRRAAQHALDAGQQLARVERLRDVVVGAHLEPDDAVDHRRGGRQHDDRDPRVALAQVAREAQAVLAGHVDVDQREVDRLLRGQLARGAARSRRRAPRSRARRGIPRALRARPARRRRPGSWLSDARSRIPYLSPRLRIGNSPAVEG